MDKCVIFGAGDMGRKSYYKISQYFDVLYYADNNVNLQGKKLNGTEIISMDDLVTNYSLEIKVIVCTFAYREIVNQLLERGISNYIIMLEGLMYSFDDTKVLIPYEQNILPYYKKKNEEKNILFVQNIPCVRTHKIAALMKERGWKVFLLYLIAPSTENEKAHEEKYEKVFSLSTQKGIVDFVSNSEFDIVHSSNAPDYLTALLLKANKPIVHDCHDMMTLKGYDNSHVLTLEYIAHTQSAGVIYCAEGARRLAEKIFRRDDGKIFVLENYITKQLARKKNLTKLSEADGQIHCVYEGVISDDPQNSRFCEKIWEKITDHGVHIHFYSPSNEWYCKQLAEKNSYLHYEGNMGSLKLANEMSKYDCGLVVYNVNEKSRTHLEATSINKVYEYINAGIPAVVVGLQTWSEFVEKNKVGISLDLDKDIREQLQRASQIKIKDNFLSDNELTMEAKGEELEQFYEKIIFEFYCLHKIT